MEAYLEANWPPSDVKQDRNVSNLLRNAVSRLSKEVEEKIPQLLSQTSIAAKDEQESSSDTISLEWIRSLFQNTASEVSLVDAYTRQVLDIAMVNDESQQQASLFELFGESRIESMMELAPKLPMIKVCYDRLVTELGLPASTTPALIAETYIDPVEAERERLRQEALDANHIADMMQAEYEQLVSISGHATHVAISKKTEKEARKTMEKTRKRARQAQKRAEEAGAIVLEEDMVNLSHAATFGPGGVPLHASARESVMSELLPAGSRQAHDQKGLPTGAEHIQEGDMEKVIVPATSRDEASLHERFKISDIMDPVFAQAFAGTTSLNPMQSTVFETAFHNRDNMLVCAPTGAGKTNVAMLTVVSHFRDVGLLGSDLDASNHMDTGVKVIYIAPMKALAQEIVEKFSSKLKPLRLIVRELTGDMQLTRAEAESANMIVTTPEKWDVVTRKSGTDEKSLGNQCGLLIIDEVHLLADERGAVIESVVSRLHRLVESRQKQIRIVALSATLPNYEDAAAFLQVPKRGLFFFGPEYRPVPLAQQFIGVTKQKMNRTQKEQRMNGVCFDVVLDSLQRGHQVMVFVHSRKGTGDTARALAKLASDEGVLDKNFCSAGKTGKFGEAFKKYASKARKSRNREVSFHFENGLGIHHAGMLRSDRKLTEQMFFEGAIKTLVCTATLAWGVNLPTHSVVIKGTDIYNPEKGGNVDLSILDVQQIFGRAGRPQFDTLGEATLITTLDAFPRYLNKLVRPVPIESNFSKQLADHLNAEIVGRTVTNIQEAASWLKYTFMYVRMQRNHLAYGISADLIADDPLLTSKCVDIVKQAARLLDEHRMIRYHEPSGNLAVADNGIVAAHYYVQTETMASFQDLFSRTDIPSNEELCRLLCTANEFDNMKVRQDEMEELQSLESDVCPLRLHGAGQDEFGRTLVTDHVDKAFVLLQAYISKAKLKSFTLISDISFINSNGARIARALFEIARKKSIATASTRLLRIAKSIEQQTWWFQSPMHHFGDEIGTRVYAALDEKCRSYDATIELLDVSAGEVSQLLNWKQGGTTVQTFVRFLPRLHVECRVLPVTDTVLRFAVNIEADFTWSKRWHGSAQSFWLFVEDGDTDKILHHEFFSLSFRNFDEPVALAILVPLFSKIPENYTIRILSDHFVGVEMLLPVSLRDVTLPQTKTPYTPLLDLAPLPTTALKNPQYEALYTKFEAFNTIQTQLFHTLYHSDVPVFLGAPTGSGKTIVAELCLLRMKSQSPDGLCVYIAPLKALARERLQDWRDKFGKPPLNWNVLEVSGDTSHDQLALAKADVLVCTPEKWDLVSRSWRTHGSKHSKKRFVTRCRLLVIDEIHLLGEERGAVLEAIVSRTRFISRVVLDESKHHDTGHDAIRIVGLSTALANPIDLADWMGIDTRSTSSKKLLGMYNFSPTVRPVPVKVSVQGYDGRHYCPRMASMNKPCFAAIRELAPEKPTLIFVSSRRQTRLTAFDLISYAASEENPRRFVRCEDSYLDAIVENIEDESLRHSLSFGIGLHHAGLSSRDREVVEQLYLNREIQVLVATATLSWGLNTPSYLVIVKGTEYFDGKTSRYVDYPLTDVLQMIGRAGRPGYDTQARAVVMVQQQKKAFYHKFLYSPFPVESCLVDKLPEILNAEISSGTISSIVDAVGYLTWTFFARRAKANPSFYGFTPGGDQEVFELDLMNVVNESVSRLTDHGCTERGSEDDETLSPTPLGSTASTYYLDHRTPKKMLFGMREACRLAQKHSECFPPVTQGQAELLWNRKLESILCSWILYSVCSTHEYDELPVRHNEEMLNEELSADTMWGPDTASILNSDDSYIHRQPDIFEDPHTKAFLLVQAFLQKLKLPISDFVNDSKTVLDQLPRLLAAMQNILSSDLPALAGSFEVASHCFRVRQYLSTRTVPSDKPILQIPGLNKALKKTAGGKTLRSLRATNRSEAKTAFNGAQNLDKMLQTLYKIPLVTISKAEVTMIQEKTVEKKLSGQVSVELNVECAVVDERNSVAFEILVGTLQSRILLGTGHVELLPKKKSVVVKRSILFDWERANADGGEEGGSIILRVVLDNTRGFDLQRKVPLR